MTHDDPTPAAASPRSRRAAPLSHEDRRASILTATVPLLLERGLDVSTRDLAAAAGVAEGTLFRVFPDKASLVRAAVGKALDPSDLVAHVTAVHGLDLRCSLTAAVGSIFDRIRTAGRLLAVVHQLPRDGGGGPAPDGPPAHAPGAHGPAGHGDGGPHPAEAVAAALAELLAPHAGALRQPPEVCARLVVSFALGAARPGATPLTLSASDLVDLLLDGLLLPTATPSPETPC